MDVHTSFRLVKVMHTPTILSPTNSSGALARAIRAATHTICEKIGSIRKRRWRVSPSLRQRVTTARAHTFTMNWNNNANFAHLPLSCETLSRAYIN